MADQLYYCDICQKSLNSKDQFDQHKEGGPHKAKEKKLKEQNSIGANNAASNYFSQSNDNVVNSVPHVNEIPDLPKQSDASPPQARDTGKFALMPSQSSDNHRNLNSDVLSCDLCETTFTCEMDKNKHLGGKSHAAKLKRLEEQKTTASNNSPSNSSDGFRDNTQPSQPDSSLPQARDTSKLPLMSTQSSDNHRSLNSNTLSCDLCKTTFTCEKDKQKHSEGKSHAAKLKRLSEQKMATANNSPSNSPAAPLTNSNDVPIPNDVPILKENPNQPSQSYACMPQGRADDKTSPTPISSSGTYGSQNPNRRETGETSSFFFRSSDLPDDVLSVTGWPDQTSHSVERLFRAQRSVPPTSSFNDLNRPARHETNLPVADVSAYNDLNQSQSMNLERESEQSRDNNNSNTVLLSEGNGTDFDYDFNTKTGHCHVCCTTLSSEQQAVDHIDCLGHKKKKKTHDLLKREKTQKKPDRQISDDDNIEQTKRKEFVGSNKKDAEQTMKEFYQAGASPVDETCPMNQTQVKEVNNSRRPTAVVTPRHVNAPFLPTSAPSDQAAAADADSNPTTATNATPTIRPQPNTRSSNEYCEICRLSLTSQEHADDHYGGRQHRRMEERFLQDQRRSDNADNNDGRKKVTVSVNVEVEL